MNVPEIKPIQTIEYESKQSKYGWHKKLFSIWKFCNDEFKSHKVSGRSFNLLLSKFICFILLI